MKTGYSFDHLSTTGQVSQGIGGGTGRNGKGGAAVRAGWKCPAEPVRHSFGCPPSLPSPLPSLVRFCPHVYGWGRLGRQQPGWEAAVRERGDRGGRGGLRDGLKMVAGTGRRARGSSRYVPPVVSCPTTSYTKGTKKGCLETIRKECAGAPWRWDGAGGRYGRTRRVLGTP